MSDLPVPAGSRSLSTFQRTSVGWLQRFLRRFSLSCLPLKKPLTQLLACYGVKGDAAELAIRHAGWRPSAMRRLVEQARTQQLFRNVDAVKSNFEPYEKRRNLPMVILSELWGTTSAHSSEELLYGLNSSERHHPMMRESWQSWWDQDSDIGWEEVLIMVLETPTYPSDYFIRVRPALEDASLELITYSNFQRVPLIGNAVVPLPWLRIIVRECFQPTRSGYLKPVKVEGSIADWANLFNLLEKQRHNS